MDAPLRRTALALFAAALLVVTGPGGAGAAAPVAPATAAPPVSPAPVTRLDLHKFTFTEAPTPYGWQNLVAMSVGDLDGDAQNELVFAFPSGPVRRAAKGPDTIQAAASAEGRPGEFEVEAWRLVGAWKGTAFQLFIAPLAHSAPFTQSVNGLVLASLDQDGSPDAWLRGAPKVGAVGFAGKRLAAKEPWRSWNSAPVPLARYVPRTGGGPGREKLLAAASFVPPETLEGLLLVGGTTKGPVREREVPLSSQLSAGDRLAVGDADGDGREELLIARSRYSHQFPKRPLVALDLWSGRPRATFYSQTPDALAVGDVDQDGRAEIVVAENQLDEAGWPRQGIVRILRWGPDGLKETQRLVYPKTWVADLAAADGANNNKTDLVLALLERTAERDTVVLRIILPLSGGS